MSAAAAGALTSPAVSGIVSPAHTIYDRFGRAIGPRCPVCEKSYCDCRSGDKERDAPPYRQLDDVCEYQTTGIDEYLQGRGGEPFGLSGVGLRIPPLITPPFNTKGQTSRYLFQLLCIPIYQSEAVRIEYIRQVLTIGALDQATRPTEMLVGGDGASNPYWQMPGSQAGSVSWHIRMVPHNLLGQIPTTAPLDSANFRFGLALGPALLYQAATFPAANIGAGGRPDFYTSLTSYTPPNGGVPYGVAVTPELGTFFDIRYPSRSQSTDKLGIIVPGPGLLCAFATVRQANGIALVTSGIGTAGISNEDNFVNAYPGGGKPVTNYWRIGMMMGIVRLAKSRWRSG